jgi:prevent-host-death family protein
MIKNVSIRQLRAHLADVVRDVATRMDRYIIARRGKPTAVLMCVDDYEGWLETLEIMSSKSAMADIKKARGELRRRRYYTFDKVFGRPQRKKPAK